MFLLTFLVTRIKFWTSLFWTISKCFPGGLAVKNLSAMQEPQETQIQSLGQEAPLQEGMATHSSILAWRIPVSRRAWWAMVHSISKSWTWLKWLRTHARNATAAIRKAPRTVTIKQWTGISLVVWWLRLCASIPVGATGSIHGQGTEIPHASRHGQKKLIN